jgi:hypothetical protein
VKSLFDDFYYKHKDRQYALEQIACSISVITTGEEKRTWIMHDLLHTMSRISTQVEYLEKYGPEAWAVQWGTPSEQ